jgi:hypothetical protein
MTRWLHITLLSCVVSACTWLPCAQATHVAPTHDATSTSSQTAVTTPSYTHTRGVTCPNPVAITGVIWQDGTPATLSGVTYGGNAMTSLCTPGAGCTGNAMELDAGPAFNSLWIYKNPSSGGATVQATFSEVVNGVTIHTSTFCNVDQTTSTGTLAGAEGGATTASVVVTSAIGDLVTDSLAGNADGGANASYTVGAGQTEQANFSVSGNHRHMASTEPGASTVTMSWTLSVAKTWGILGVALKPAADVGGPSCTGGQLMLGVGGSC